MFVHDVHKLFEDQKMIVVLSDTGANKDKVIGIRLQRLVS
jgi:hypothetical protein